MVTCSERVKHIYPKNVYYQKETLFEETDASNISNRDEQKLIRNLAIFNFECIFANEKSTMETETTKWIGKHGPILFSIPSNFLQAPLPLCNNEPDHPVSPFVSALKCSATQSKA